MVLELAGDGAFDGPVAGVVHARRHLVGDQLALADEELDGQHARVTEMGQHALQMPRGEALQPRRAERRARQAQDASGMHVAVERIDRDLAARDCARR